MAQTFAEKLFVTRQGRGIPKQHQSRAPEQLEASPPTAATNSRYSRRGSAAYDLEELARAVVGDSMQTVLLTDGPELHALESSPVGSPGSSAHALVPFGTVTNPDEATDDGCPTDDSRDALRASTSLPSTTFKPDKLLYVFPSSPIDSIQQDTFEYLQVHGLRLEKRTPHVLLYCSDPGMLPRRCAEIMAVFCEDLKQCLGDDVFSQSLQMHVHFCSFMSSQTAEAVEERTKLSPAFMRGVTTLEIRQSHNPDPFVIIARSLAEAKVGIAALVAGGSFINSVACTFPLFALGVKAFADGVRKTFGPPPKGRNAPSDDDYACEMQRKEEVANFLVHTCQDLENVLWMQRGPEKTLELGEGVLNYVATKMGPATLRRFLMMHIDPTRNNKARTLVEGGVAVGRFDISSPETKLHQMYIQINAVSRLSLGMPFIQLWLQWVNLKSEDIASAWEKWEKWVDVQKQKEEIQRQAERFNMLETTTQHDLDKVPMDDTEGQDDGLLVQARDPRIVEVDSKQETQKLLEFRWPQALEQVISTGADEGRITLEHISRLRERLRGGPLDMVVQDVRSNPTWVRIITDDLRDEEVTIPKTTSWLSRLQSSTLAFHQSDGNENASYEQRRSLLYAPLNNIGNEVGEIKGCQKSLGLDRNATGTSSSQPSDQLSATALQAHSTTTSPDTADDHSGFTFWGIADVFLWVFPWLYEPKRALEDRWMSNRYRLRTHWYLSLVFWASLWPILQVLMIEYLYHLTADQKGTDCRIPFGCDYFADSEWDSEAYHILEGLCAVLILLAVASAQTDYTLLVHVHSVGLRHRVKTQILDMITSASENTLDTLPSLKYLDSDLKQLDACVMPAHFMFRTFLQMCFMLLVLFRINKIVFGFIICVAIPALACIRWSRMNFKKAHALQEELDSQEHHANVAMMEQVQMRQLNQALGTQVEATKRSMHEAAKLMLSATLLSRAEEQSCRMDNVVCDIFRFVMIVLAAITLHYDHMASVGTVTVVIYSYWMVMHVGKMAEYMHRLRQTMVSLARYLHIEKVLADDVAIRKEKHAGAADDPQKPKSERKKSKAQRLSVVAQDSHLRQPTMMKKSASTVFAESLPFQRKGADENSANNFNVRRKSWNTVHKHKLQKLRGRVDLRVENISLVNELGIPGSSGELEVTLKGVSMDIPSGATIGVLGRSRVGKSSLVKALSGRHRICEGEILLDNVPVTNITQLHVCTAVMDAEPILFEENIDYNITIGRKVDEHDLQAALRAAMLTDDPFLEEVGMEFLVGPNGNNLPPDFRQRVSLARILLLKCPLVILDEPASMQKNHDVIKQLAQNFKGSLLDDPECARTTTVIAFTQLVQMVQDFDEVYVLNNGTVVERGAPATLAENNGLFSQMKRTQELLHEVVRNGPLQAPRPPEHGDGINLTAPTRNVMISAAGVKELWPFAALSEESAWVIASVFQRHTLLEGTELFRQGQVMDKLVVVLSGTLVERTKKDRGDKKLRRIVGNILGSSPVDDQEEIVYRHLRYGDTVGEESALFDTDLKFCTEKEDENIHVMDTACNMMKPWASHYTGTAVATSTCDVLILPREVLVGVLMFNYPLTRELVHHSRTVRKMRSWHGLGQIWTLYGCPQVDLHCIAEHLELRCYKTGDVIINQQAEQGTEVVSWIGPGTYFGETSPTCWTALAVERKREGAEAAMQNVSVMEVMEDPTRSRLLGARCTTDTIMFVLNPSQMGLLKLRHPAVLQNLILAVRANMRLHEKCVTGVYFMHNPFWAETPMTVLRRLGQTMDFSSHPSHTMLLQRTSGYIAKDQIVILLRGKVRVLLEDPSGMTYTMEFEDGAILNREVFAESSMHASGSRLLSAESVTSVLLATQGRDMATKTLFTFRTTWANQSMQGMGEILAYACTIKGMRSIGLGDLPDSQLVALVSTCKIHFFLEGTNLIEIDEQCPLPYIIPNGLTMVASQTLDFLCVVLYGTVRVWERDDEEDPGRLIVAGGFFTSRGIVQPKPGPFWRMAVGNITKAVVEARNQTETGASIALFDVSAAHTIDQEIEWMIAQGQRTRVAAMYKELRTYGAKIQSNIGRLKMSLGWIPEAELRLIAAQRRWQAVYRRVKRELQNGTTSRMLFGYFPTMQADLETTVVVDLVPLEEELLRLREVAMNRQDEILRLRDKWMQIGPMQSDVFQFPDCIDCHNLSNEYIESLQEQLMQVKNQRVGDYMTGITQARKLWARGLNGIPPNGKRTQSSAKVKAKLESFLGKEVVPQDAFELLQTELDALRRALRPIVMEKLSAVQALYTELDIRKFDPDLDRYRLANPHEDIVHELDRELEKMQFAKSCLQPVQEATKVLIESATSRSLSQAKQARAHGTYEALMNERLSLMDHMEMEEEELQMVVKVDLPPPDNSKSEDVLELEGLGLEVTELRNLLLARQLEHSKLCTRLIALADQVGESASYKETMLSTYAAPSQANMDSINTEIAALESKTSELKQQQMLLQKQVEVLWDAVYAESHERDHLLNEVKTAPNLYNGLAVLQREHDRLNTLDSNLDRDALIERSIVGKYTGDYDSLEAKQKVNKAVCSIQAKFRGNRFFKRYSLLRRRLNAIKHLYLRFDKVEPADRSYEVFCHSLQHPSETDVDASFGSEDGSFLDMMASNLSNMLEAAMLRKQELEVYAFVHQAIEIVKNKKQLKISEIEQHHTFKAAAKVAMSIIAKEAPRIDLSDAVAHLDNELSRYVCRTPPASDDDEAGGESEEESRSDTSSDETRPKRNSSASRRSASRSRKDETRPKRNRSASRRSASRSAASRSASGRSRSRAASSRAASAAAGSVRGH